MSAQHTPGPWRQAHRKKPSGMYATEVFDASGETIATIAWHPKPTTPDGVIGTYREANAALIASAPDLLAERDRLKVLNAELAAALKAAQQAINGMKTEAESAAGGDEEMMLLAINTISNDGLDADMDIRAALNKYKETA